MLSMNLKMLVTFLLFTAVVIYYIISARRGAQIFIRPIRGMTAIEDAIGRATEMGRPVLFVPGSGDITDIQTLAGVSILGYVTKEAALLHMPLYVPIRYPLVYPLVCDTLQTSYLEAGRPDLFNEDNVRFLSKEQWGFTTGTVALINEHKPGAILLMGLFQAESLILAEVGNTIGAIQIAGTARPSQLPFFIAACDFTLIGEELFAANAYLTADSVLTATIKAQDVFKLIIISIILLGAIAQSFNLSLIHDFFIVE